MSNFLNTLDKYFCPTKPSELNLNDNQGFIKQSSKEKSYDKTHTRSDWDPRWIK
ncbi:17267_t:CDS:1, partial [Cetraspora pellucida]